MKIIFFCHSLLSDWNNGHAHFLRGVAAELIERGHQVSIYEPKNGWSLSNLRKEHGELPISEFAHVYPKLSSVFYERINPRKILADADLVLVHEWNEPELIATIGKERERSGHFKLFFHDTHHRAVTARKQIEAFDLSHYDGVLAYGQVITDLYLAAGWNRRAWTWHEAADVRVFRPSVAAKEQDFVWIGNWGDGERSAELIEFLLRPVKTLGLQAVIHGVRYPASTLKKLNKAGIAFRGWLPNFAVPRVFAASRITIHVPRRPYAKVLPGIPTIRPFEALACGIPLVSAPWNDSEKLFRPGKDFLLARNETEMTRNIKAILRDEALAEELTTNGLETIMARHTCAHRVDQLLEIYSSL